MHSTAYAPWRWGVMSTVFHTLRQASDFSYQKKGVLGSNVVLCSSSCSRTFLMGLLAQLWATRLCCPSEVLLFSSDVVWDPGAHQPARPHPLLSSAVLPQAIQGFQSHIPLCKQVIPQSCTISLTLRNHDPSLLMKKGTIPPKQKWIPHALCPNVTHARILWNPLAFSFMPFSSPWLQMSEILVMQDGGKKYYSPVSAVTQVALSVLIHICGMHVFPWQCGILHSAHEGGIAWGSVHIYIFWWPKAEIARMNFWSILKFCFSSS